MKGQYNKMSLDFDNDYGPQEVKLDKASLEQLQKLNNNVSVIKGILNHFFWNAIIVSIIALLFFATR